MDGSINVCKWVRLAVERHYKDMERQRTEDFPYYFEPKAVEHYVHYFRDNFVHYEGAIDGEPIIFEPWQWFAFGSPFGWLKVKRFKDIPIRRFRQAVIIIPKKNGKSIVSGGTGLYMMDADEWSAAQCYVMAKSDLHAKELGYRAATTFVEKNEELSSKYQIVKAAGRAGIYYAGNNNSFYKTITPKAESQDGRNVHFFGPDETKDWDDFEIFGTMKNGTVNAPNSLIMSTTTAGPNENSLGFKQQQYLEKVLSGTIEDESHFGVIYTIDKEDKEDPDYWRNPEIWEKANPNFNVSVYEDTLQEMIPSATQNLSDRIDFETKHLDIWHSSISGFIEAEKWQGCNKRFIPPLFADFKNLKGSQEEREERIDEIFENFFSKYRGAKAFGAIDLGSVSDFSSFCLPVWNDEFDEWDIVSLFWIPEDNLKDRPNYHLIKPWIEAGYIQTTPGSTTDHSFMEYCIKKIAEYVDIIEVPFDRYKADAIATNLLDDGILVIKYGQGYISMAPAVDALEKYILDKKINNGDNPVLTWMIGNAVTSSDPTGNRKWRKDKAQDKIDGVVTCSMALARASLIDVDESNDPTDLWV